MQEAPGPCQFCVSITLLRDNQMPSSIIKLSVTARGVVTQPVKLGLVDNRDHGWLGGDDPGGRQLLIMNGTALGNTF
jgi:hypothetical protein